MYYFRLPESPNMPGLIDTPDTSVKKSDKDIDLSNSERGVWLVKVPKYIADRWSKADPSTEVGRLRLDSSINLQEKLWLNSSFKGKVKLA